MKGLSRHYYGPYTQDNGRLGQRAVRGLTKRFVAFVARSTGVRYARLRKKLSCFRAPTFFPPFGNRTR